MSYSPELQALAVKYSPHLYYYHNEPYFPISIEDYLSICELRQNKSTSTDPDLTNYNVLEPVVTPTILGNYTDAQTYQNTYLVFNNPNYDTILKGDPKNTTTYCKIIDLADGMYAFIYTFLYVQTLPYRLFGCLCNLKSYSHLGDVKNVIIYANSTEVLSAYYSAHGYHDGQYVECSDMKFEGSHPIVYPSHKDHSSYYNVGCHPRIYCAVCDFTEHKIASTPNVVLVDDNTTWCNYQGSMNNEGIRAPGCQPFWNNDVPSPKDSNNWFRRLCCYNYF